ncbi:MAG: methyl-viologen-reducing hydrogenase subunit delta [Chlorobiaceae bacterium]|nr:methyl-viologen-reducing hydrogenase subunit delta [Chlorobiaceae bacterium]
MEFEPKIVAFLCNWCTYTGADLAGVSRLKSPANIRVIRTMCSGRVDPTFVMKAFDLGADGVLIGGCHPGDCHYAEGNYKTLRRAHMLKKIMRKYGIDEKRLRLEWISAAEGDKFQEVTTTFTETIRSLGPLDWRKRIGKGDRTEHTVAV